MSIETKGYLLQDHYVGGGGVDSGLGSADDGEWLDIGSDAVLSNIDVRRERFFTKSIQIQEFWVFVNTAFAAASTNTFTMQTGTVSGTQSTPADALVLTITAAATGIFTTTGSPQVIADVTFILCLFNSDDATDPASMNARGMRYRN